MLFTYSSKTKDGLTVQGTMEGADRFAVAKELRARSQTPVTVAPLSTKKEASTQEFLERFLNLVSMQDKIMFANNLAGMLTAGLTLYRALEIEEKQVKNHAFKTVIAGLMTSINQGQTLSGGLAKYPSVFSSLFVAMVRAGEESGKLSESLREIGINLEKSYALNRKIKSAMLYPVMVVLALLAVGILMLEFVVPTLAAIFNNLGTPLPFTTRLVVAASNAITHHPFFTFGALILIGIFFLVLASERLKPFHDAIVLRLPIAGKLIKQVNTARTARTLSSLLSSGVEMTRALSITRDVLQNLEYKAVLDKALSDVEKGKALSAVFRDATRLYPITMGEMISVGEETGALADMLQNIAVYHEEEVDTVTKNLSTVLEPLVMVVVGIGVGFFAVSMLSPMYSLVNTLSAS